MSATVHLCPFVRAGDERSGTRVLKTELQYVMYHRDIIQLTKTKKKKTLKSIAWPSLHSK